MIEKINKVINVVNTIMLIVIAVVLVGSKQLALGAAGDINTVPVWYTKGIYGGSTKQLTIDSSGNITTSGSTTLTGALSVSGAIAGTGATSVSTFTQGGGCTATSTSGTTVPLVASNFDTENCIDVTLNVQDATLSFPATSTLTSIIPNAGDQRVLYIRNATTTAAMDLTITGGTGVLLKKATSTAVIYGDTDGANYGRIELKRKANTDIEAMLQIFMD